MERNEGIVRWSLHQSRNEFLRINLTNRVINLYKATGQAQPGKFEYSNISRHSNFPTISGYDWSPIVRGLVGIGTPQGEIHLLRIDDNSNACLKLPLKLSRACQAVAFNTTGLLAVGLDRVRHDSGLQIWDVNERLADWDSSKSGWIVPTLEIEPRRKLEGSMSVTSIRFFEDSPQTLIFGVRNQALKIYDLRGFCYPFFIEVFLTKLDPNFTAISFQTRCNNNIAIDYLDTNYFASSTLDLPGLIIFDKRAAGDRSTASTRYVEAFEEERLPWGAVLKLDRVIDGDKSVSVKQLRFSREHSGALGVLSTSGQLKVLHSKKEYIDPIVEENPLGSPELIEIRKSHELERSRSGSSSKKKAEQRILSFDWLYMRTVDLDARIIGLQANGQFRIFQVPSSTSAHLLQIIPWAHYHKSSDLNLTLPRFNDPKQREEVLGPLYTNIAKLNVPLFGPNRYGTTKSKIDIVSKIKALIESQDMVIYHNYVANFTPSLEFDMLGRAVSGYLFDCQKNKSLTENNPRLMDVWDWISGAEEAAKNDGMVTGPLDLSYMGVYSIWTNNLGKKSNSRLINETVIPDHNQWEYLICKLERINHCFEFDNIETAKPYHRILCLAICDGLRTEDETLKSITDLAAAGNYASAACLALLEGQPKLSVKILKDGGSEYLFLAMALDMKIMTSSSSLLPESDWKGALNSDRGLSNNAYIRAIYRYVSMGSWEAVAQERSLPLRRRLALALRKFGDTKLTEWLENEMQESINTGDIEGVILAGITDSTVSILAKYIEVSGDLQTAILILSFCYPRYIDDIRCHAWREEYRAFLNRHKRFIDRVKFDQESIKKSRNRDGVSILKPPPRQVTIRCLNCDNMTANDLANSTASGTAMIPDNSWNPLTVSGINAGLKCPRCGMGLPRCVVCMHHVLGQPRSDKPELSTDPVLSKSATNFPSFCMKCKHVMHLEHAILWFSRHEECPVSECFCRCNDMTTRYTRIVIQICKLKLRT